MTHAIAIPVSRYGLAGSLSLILTLLMFLVLFDTIKAPGGTFIIPIPAPPKSVFKTLAPPKPVAPIERKKPEFKPGDKTRIIVPPITTTDPPVDEIKHPDWTRIEIGSEVGAGPPQLLENEVIDIIKIGPAYPFIALTQGIEGYVIVEYGVTAYGTTSDIRIIEARPDNIFNQSSIDAVAKFKFKPRVVNGTPVETRGLRNKFVFELKN